MINPQVNQRHAETTKDQSEQLFLRQGDWIIINFHSYNLFCQGFKTSQLSLKQTAQSNIISSIFVVESYGRLESKQYRKTSKLVFYGEKVLFQHLLSGKYLSYSHHSTQEEVRLKYGKTGNCLFTIKPIFKCQASFSRKIRIDEQICLQSMDKLKLYIQLGDKNQDEVECLVSMRKHESSILLVDRINSLDRKKEKISNLLVYQLVNIENQYALQASKNKFGQFQVNFTKNVNIYGSFITLELVVYDKFPKEAVIQFKDEVFIKFYTNSYYLGFDQAYKVQLHTQKNQNCIFVFQDYDDNELKQDYTMKVKHFKSQIYLSLNKNKLQLRQFSLVNTFCLKNADHNLLKITLLINEIYQSFTLIVKQNIISNRLQFQQLLKQLLKFIFPQAFHQQNYLKMNETIKLKISLSQQILLAKVGFIGLIAQTIGDIISILNVDSQGKSIYQQGISNMMLILLGICYKNTQNTEILIKYLPIIYEGIAFNCGIIQALYYIFSDNANLRLFQKADHRIKKTKICSIQLLIDYLYKQQSWDAHVKEKIFKLLQKLIKPKGEQKLLLHQFSLIRALKQSRLDKIWTNTKIIDEDLYVRFQDQLIQLQGFFQKKAKYHKQIDLIRAQFHFLCTLYSNPNSSNLTYFRTIFPQVSLLNYLKTKMLAEERRILLRILCEIYLQPLMLPHNFLINIQNDQQIQNINRFRDYDYRVLEKIRDQIIETLRQGFLNQIVDEALYMYIQTIRMFYELNMIQQQEWCGLERLMQGYLLKNFSLVDKFREVKKLAEEIIKSHEFSQKILIYRYTKVIIKMLNTRQTKKKVASNSTHAENVLCQILSEPFFSSQEARFTFLNNLIQYSLQKDSQIFVKSCMLLKRITQRSYLLLQDLRMVIILDNEWYENIVLEGKQLHEQLKNLLMQYRKLHNQQQSLTGINISICKKIVEIKGLLYRREKVNQLNKVSPLMQNILRELNIHETIVIFLRDYQRQLRDKSKHSIFFEMFDFLLLFFNQNFTNLNICIRQFRLIKWLFTYQSVGQSKILYLLISNNYSLQILRQELKETALLCIKQCKLPNCYGIMSLIRLMINKEKSDTVIVNFITEQIIQEHSLLENIWKINDKGTFSYQLENNEQPYYFQEFGFYLFLVIKLFMIIIQFSSHEKEVTGILKKKIPLQTLLKIMIWKDYLDQSQIQYFGSYLLKIQLIKYCQKLYDAQELTQRQQKLFKQMCVIFTGKLSTCHTIGQLSYPDLSKAKNIYELQIQCLKVKNNFCAITTQETFHFVVVTTFYPFLLQITHKIHQNSRDADEKQEIQLAQLKSFRKIKELMSQLPKSNYRIHLKGYNRAIVFIQDIIKYKLNFELQQSDEQLHSYKQLEYQQQQRIYRVQKLHNLAENCQVLTKDGGHENAVEIYKTILILMYSPRVRKLLDSSNMVIKSLQDGQTLMKIIGTVIRVFDEDLLKTSDALDLIWLFIRNNPFLIDFICQIDTNYINHIIKLLVKDREKDHFGKNLGKYLQIVNFIMNKFLSSKFVLNSNIFQQNYQYADAHGQQYTFRNIFAQRMQANIKMEMAVYDRTSFESQLEYFELLNSRLNYQQLQETFHINHGLEFVSNQLEIRSDRSYFTPLVFEILLLLRVYVKFISDFNLNYMPKQLLQKIIICLDIIYHAVNPIDEKVITYIHEGNYFREFQVLLRLRDNWYLCQMQSEKSPSELMRNIAKGLSGWQAQWLYLSSNLCELNVETYGPEITYYWGQFPLQAAKSLYGPLKQSLMNILKTLKSCNITLGHQIVYQLSLSTISQNIVDIYYKHYHTFGKYTEASVNPKLITYKSQNLKHFAQTLCFENGVTLISLMIFIDNRHSRGELYVKYINYGGFVSDISIFFSNFRLLLLSSQERMIPENKIDKIYEYFYKKMAMVEVIQNNELYSIDFLIRPQCIVHRAVKSEFMGSINFISTQVKLQSILQQSQNMSIFFNCFSKFAIKFRNLSIIIFLQKYLSLIRSINLLLLFANNIYLLINSDQQDSFYLNFVIADPFETILLVNLILSGVFVIIYSIRNIPIIRAQMYKKIQRESLHTDYSPRRLRFMLFRDIISNKQLVYHFLFLALLLLAIINKLFVALLLLDLLIQIKSMKLIFMTLWKAKSQLIYTFISFFLLHYFYTIIMFILFEDKAKTAYCDDFGSCFGFVYNLCFKLVGGFVGFIYMENYNSQTFQLSLHFYDIIEDIYLIMVFQVFAAVILVIIIDEYSKNTHKNAEIRQNLSHNCIICGLSRSVFNFSTLGNFRTHISSQHNVWNYVYYYQYLNSKPIGDRSKMENQIIMKHTIQWLPNGYAKGFQQPSKY